MNDKLRELEQVEMDLKMCLSTISGYHLDNHATQLLLTSSMGYVNSLVRLINTPKHETVKEWETRTGESYPDDGAVWCLMSYTPSMHRVNPYWELIEYGKVDSINKCIIANHHGKPEIEG